MKQKIFAIPNEKNIGLTINNVHNTLVIATQEEIKSKTIQDLLKALKVNINTSVSLIGINKKSHFSLASHLAETSIKRILVFGLSPKYLRINIQEKVYSFMQFENFKILFSESISVLNTDKNKKIRLWKELQTNF